MAAMGPTDRSSKASSAKHDSEIDSVDDDHDQDPGQDSGSPTFLGRLLRLYSLQSAVAVMLLVMALWRASVYGGAWFGSDDFVYQSLAHQLGPSEALLTLNYDGQYMPGGFLLVVADEALAPLNWNLVVAENVLLQALAGWTFWRLLRTLFVPRYSLLIPLGLYLLTPLTVPAGNWWAVSLNTLPLLVVMPLALTSHVQLLRTGRHWHGVFAAFWVAVGLLFFVKAALIVLTAVMLTAVLRLTTGEQLSLAKALWRCRLEWGLLAVLFAVYAPLYFSASTTSSSSGIQVPHNVGDLLSLYENGIGHVLVPGILGGPWKWIGTYAPTAVSDTPFFALFVSWLAVGALVLVACRLRRRAHLMWLLVLLYAFSDLTFVAVGRLNQLNGTLALESHYVADAMPLVWLAVAFSFLPVRGEPGRPVRWERLNVPAVLGHQLALAMTLAGAVAVSSVFSVHAFTRDRQSRQAARTFVETATKELLAAPDDLTLYDRNVPSFLLNGLFLRMARTSQVLAPVTPARFGNRLYPVASESPMLFDEGGHLHPATVSGVELKQGPTPGCGWLVQNRSVSLPFRSEIFDFDWTVRVGYLASRDTTIMFRFGRSTVRAAVHKGLGQVIFPVSGKGPALELTVAAKVGVCIGDGQIGRVLAAR